MISYVHPWVRRNALNGTRISRRRFAPDSTAGK
jgi:hypothetical protein